MHERAGTGWPVSALFVGAMGAGLAVLLSACADSCANRVVTAVPSPDGRQDAVIFQRDCGATTGFSTQISIVDHSEALIGSGNLFVADDDHGAAATGPSRGPMVEVRWLSADRLLVRYARGSRIFYQKRDLAGVAVIYRVANYPSPRS